jgi:hypothetical protein
VMKSRRFMVLPLADRSFSLASGSTLRIEDIRIEVMPLARAACRLPVECTDPLSCRLRGLG